MSLEQNYQRGYCEGEKLCVGQVWWGQGDVRPDWSLISCNSEVASQYEHFHFLNGLSAVVVFDLRKSIKVWTREGGKKGHFSVNDDLFLLRDAQATHALWKLAPGETGW